MNARTPKIVIDGREFSRLIHYPKAVRDGTLRCICCGQIDAAPWHEASLCGPTPKAQAFILANRESPVISGRVIEPDPSKPGKGASYRLENGKRFRLSRDDCRSMSMPRWKHLNP